MLSNTVTNGNHSRIGMIGFGGIDSNEKIVALCILKNEGGSAHGKKIGKVKIVEQNPKEPLPTSLQTSDVLILGGPDGPYDKMAASNGGVLMNAVAKALHVNELPHYQCVMEDFAHERNDTENLFGYIDRLRKTYKDSSAKTRFYALIDGTSARIKFMLQNFELAKDAFNSGAKMEKFQRGGEEIKVASIETFHRNLFLQSIAHKLHGKDVLVNQARSSFESNNPIELEAYHNYNRRDVTISLKEENGPLLEYLFDKLEAREARRNKGGVWQKIGKRAVATKSSVKTILRHDDISSCIRIAFEILHGPEKETVSAEKAGAACLA